MLSKRISDCFRKATVVAAPACRLKLGKKNIIKAAPCLGHVTDPIIFSKNYSIASDIKKVQTKHKMKKPNIPEIQGVQLNSNTNAIEIDWAVKSEKKSLYPYVWLRDHCQCETCFHPISRSRTMLFEDLQLDVKPINFQLNNKTSVSIEWSDGHLSEFDSQWLKDRTFGYKLNDTRKAFYKLKPVTWGSEILQNLPMANFQQLMTDERALLTWLQQLEVYGFVMIMNAPAEQGQVRKLIEKVAFIKKTHYGAEFSVTAKQDPSNVAYSRGPLQLHTDLPYYEYKPGIQLVHCVVQFEGRGAESQVADAAHAAKILKKEKPELYKVLTETNVDWCDIGTDEGRDFFKVLQTPVICLNSKGEVIRINFSHPQRDSFFDVELPVVAKWYEAMKVFSEILYDSKNCLQFKMLPGTIQSFDNHRIVHGRKSYEDFPGGEREIEGCYMDWDEARSKRRVLERKLDLSSHHFCQNKL